MTDTTEPLDVEWVDDLPTRSVLTGGRPSVVLLDVLAALVDNPKRWAVIDRFAEQKKAAAVVNTWKHRAKAPVNAGHRWEFASRKGAIYARYMGEA